MSRGKFTISTNIKTYREKLGITQDRLSKQSKVPYNVIIKIEQGVTTNPTIDTVVNIAKGLGITVDELLQTPNKKNTLMCIQCKKEYSLTNPVWQCECGGLINLNYEVSFPLEEIKKRKQTIWRYREALPIDNDKYIVSLDEPITPLTKIILENQEVYIKQDHLYSTGSYKDRGAAVLVSKIRELKVDRIVEDSLMTDMSGSASNSIAAYCANGGVTCDMYTPNNISKEILTPIQYYGTRIHKLANSSLRIDKTILNAIKEEYYANQCLNPFFLHGIKTFAFEVCEQLGWKSPDTIILPVGNGTLLLGAYIGFSELLKAGVIDKIPKIIGIQSKNCAPLYNAYKKNLVDIPKLSQKEILTEGLAIINPVRGKEIIEVIKHTNGDIITVNDHEVTEALRDIFKKGFNIELTSAATIAGVKKYLKINRNETIVSVFTGNGYKTVGKISKILNS